MEILLALPARRGKRLVLLAAHRRELALIPGEPIANPSLLCRPGRDEPRRLGHLVAGDPRRVPRLPHLDLRGLDLGRDPLVLAADVVQELELVEHVSEARRFEYDRQRLGGLGGVDLDEPPVEPLRRSLVLALEVEQPARLEAEELVQLIQLPLVEREHVLEPVEPCGGGVDIALQSADLPRHDLDLRAEDAFPLARTRDLPLEPVDPRVERLLALAETGLAGRGGGDQQRAGRGENDEEGSRHPR